MFRNFLFVQHFSFKYISSISAEAWLSRISSDVEDYNQNFFRLSSWIQFDILLLAFLYDHFDGWIRLDRIRQSSRFKNLTKTFRHAVRICRSVEPLISDDSRLHTTRKPHSFLSRGPIVMREEVPFMIHTHLTAISNVQFFRYPPSIGSLWLWNM